MRLVDRVSADTLPVRVLLDGQIHNLPGAGQFADKVRECPTRYILDGTVEEATRALIRQWPDLISPEDRNLRIPSESMWMEWRDEETVGGPTVYGVLVTADPAGRAGSVHSFWANPDGELNSAQATIEFDLDSELFGTGAASFNVFALKPAGYALDRHLVATIDPKWARYFKRTGVSVEQAAREFVDQICKDVYRVLSFARLISARFEMIRRPISRERLNASRAKSKKPPLLDHIELSMELGSRSSGAPLSSGERAASRLHVVRGHLVRRGKSVFWRSTHLRGQGEEGAPIKRTMRVRMASET